MYGMLYCGSLFISCAILSMFLTYIGQVRSKMRHLITENFKLLDKMHEGLLVVSEKDRTV